MCYAEAMSRRNPSVLGEWGPGTKRSVAAESYWNLPYKWEREAVAAGRRLRVFLGSLMDFNEDRPDLIPLRQRAWKIIAETPHLDYQTLTKRPERFPLTLPANWGAGWPNVWLGTTIGVNATLEARMEALTAVNARVRFVSAEPLLEDIADGLAEWLFAPCRTCGGVRTVSRMCGCGQNHCNTRAIQWLIIGGESSQGGQTARPFDLSWADRLLDLCRAAGVAAFVKQFGDLPTRRPGGLVPMDRIPLKIAGHHGADMTQWPARLRVRQFPVT
jgi:protein gp37